MSIQSIRSLTSLTLTFWAGFLPRRLRAGLRPLVYAAIVLSAFPRLDRSRSSHSSLSVTLAGMT